MYYHIYITDACNLSCSYCRGKIFDTPEINRSEISLDSKIPSEIQYDLDDLYRFLEKDSYAAVTFIGGEPTLRSGLIQEIMENAPVDRFMIQTNGLLLHRLPEEVVNRFSTILVSIDGDQVTTDSCRGQGTYRQVIESIQNILANGYQGEIIARMTVHEGVDIRKCVLHLADNPHYPFSSIHWQMDANFWNDYHLRRFKEWVKSSYIPGLKALVRDWIGMIRSTGTVPRWYPFIDPMEDLLKGRSSDLRCGSGYANYSVLTDGSIAPCPIMIGMKDFYLGDIVSDDPSSLKTITVGGRCLSCDIRDFCGGRCLYASIMEPWPEEGVATVCETVRELKDAIEAAIPEIRKLISEGVISDVSLYHEKFNGCEIIP